jgi:tetratricopeptide (TPR) repeat protein
VLVSLYARTLDYGFTWMDETEIAEGEIVLGDEPWVEAFRRPLHRTPDYAAGVNPYYRPFQILLATAVHRAAGPIPRYYRAISIAIGAATASAFAALAWLLLRRADLALLAALLAVVHPVGIESWLWISGNAEAFSGLWVIASVGLGLLAVGWTAPSRLTPPTNPGLLALACGITFALALLSKEKGIVVPALLLAAFACGWLGDPRFAAAPPAARRALLSRGGALVAALGVFGLAYLLLWRPAMLGDALGSSAPIGGDRLSHGLSAVACWPSSLAWLFSPLHSTTSDVVRVVDSLFDPMAVVGVLLPIFSLAIWWTLLRAGRPVAAFGLAWIWIAFLPTANLLPQIHARAERYLFLSVFGAALLVADLLPLLFTWAGPRARRIATVGLGILLVLGLAQRTWVRIPDWRSTRTLFERDVGRAPSFREGRFHLAMTLFEEGEYAQAKRELRALRETMTADAETRSNVAAVGVYELQCSTELALRRYQSALALVKEVGGSDPKAARSPSLRACRAQALESLGRHRDALATYLELVEDLPGDPPAAISMALARIYARLGRKPEGRPWIERARRDGPREGHFDFELRRIERLYRR